MKAAIANQKAGYFIHDWQELRDQGPATDQERSQIQSHQGVCRGHQLSNAWTISAWLAPGLPEKRSIPPRTARTNALFELCNHPEAECARSRNFLVTTYTLGFRSEISGNKLEKRQVLWTSGRSFKEKFRT